MRGNYGSCGLSEKTQKPEAEESLKNHEREKRDKIAFFKNIKREEKVEVVENRTVDVEEWQNLRSSGKKERQTPK